VAVLLRGLGTVSDQTCFGALLIDLPRCVQSGTSMRALCFLLCLCPWFEALSRARKVPWGSKNALSVVTDVRSFVRSVESQVCELFPECHRPSFAPCCAVPSRCSPAIRR